MKTNEHNQRLISCSSHLYADDRVLGGNYGVSKGNQFLYIQQIREKNLAHQRGAHLTRDISNDLGKRVILNLSMLVPGGKVSEFSLF